MFTNAQYVKDKKDQKIRDGYTAGGSQIDGVRLIAPLANDGGNLAAGSIVSLEGSTFKLYNGHVRIIDNTALQRDIEICKRRRAEIEDLIELILIGGDAISIKYLGPYHNCLYQPNLAGQLEKFREFMLIDGYDESQIKATFEACKCLEGDNNVDARGSSLQMKNQFSQEYTTGIMKLRLVLSYAGLLITGKQHSENMEMPTSDAGAKLFDTSHKLTNTSVNKTSVQEVEFQTGRTLDFTGAQPALKKK